jgi:hypothetical protein
MPKWPNSAVAPRKARDVVRPVVCVVGGPMWAPMSSSGTSSDVQRWICWRSSGSLLSLVQIRSVRARIARVGARSAGGAALDLDVRVHRAQLVEERVEPAYLPVHARTPVTGHRLEQVAVLVPLEERDVVLGEQRMQPLEQVA